MRAVLQRVARASVTVDGAVVGEIGAGLLVLVGVGSDDTERDADALADKVVGLRVFPDDEGKMNRSLAETGGGALVVSQFSLLADIARGRRPSFTRAAAPPLASTLVDRVALGIERAGVVVEIGRFGAPMTVELVNPGPVTIVVDTRRGRVV
jgi:D-tyrosyl-tRNA(Tyr) deacylase